MEGSSLLLVDPVAARAVGAALSIIFLTGAWEKLRDPAVFKANVENYGVLPAGMTWAFALLLPLWEFAAGVLLLFDSTRASASLMTIGLLLTVTTAVVVNLLRGRTEIDCGCGSLGGHVGDQTLGWGLPIRNGVLAVGALLAFHEDSARILVWIDFLSMVGGTLGLLGLYVTANQLMANQPRLQALRNY